VFLAPENHLSLSDFSVGGYLYSVSRQTDQQLLQDYSERRSEPAFTELVHRYVDLVYSTALRMARDAHLAEDVTQSVFLALANSAPKLTECRVLSGWLHQTTQNLAANVVRSEVRRRILIGTYVLSAGYYDAYYLRAQKVRALIARDFAEAYKKCDVILTPATPGAAFAIGEKTADPVSMYLNDVFTVTVNLAGLPGLVVPAGLTENGLPLGLQIIGKAFDEATVLRIGRGIETAANFTAKPQAWWRAA